MKELRWIKEWKERKPGDISNAADKSAEHFVSSGYAEYVEEPSLRDKHVLERAPKVNKATAVEQLGVNPDEFDRLKLEKEGLEYFKELVAPFDGTWAEVKSKINIPLIKEVLNFTLGDLKEVWAAEIKQTAKNQKDLQKQYSGRKPSIKLTSKEIDEICVYHPGINWIVNEAIRGWEDIKAHNNILLQKDSEETMFFLAHSQDKIIGKPIQITENLQIVRLISKTIKKQKGEDDKISFKFPDDRYDKRYDGYEDNTLDVPFYIYSIVYEDQQFYALSENKLNPDIYELKGMKIKMPVLNEISKALRFRGLCNLFLVKESSPAVRVMEAEELVEFTKHLGVEYNLTQENFRKVVFTHPDGNYYGHVEEYELMRVAQILGGKENGYPLHTMTMGRAGLGKTYELECLDDKYHEEKGILEAGNSTPKVLIPSFKEKPANPGYIVSCNYMALIDELMKMIANANKNGRYAEEISQYLGQLNMLLEQKDRTIGSGNDNTTRIKSTSKVIFTTNPLYGKRTIGDHVGLIDDTTLSRMLVWVRDKQEEAFINENKSKITGHTCTRLLTLIKKLSREGSENKKDIKNRLEYWRGVSSSIWPSLTLSSQNLKTIFSKVRLTKLFKTALNLSKGRMTSIWKARGEHHSSLLLDGLIKFRCLFRDYDPKFEAVDEDFDLLERILIRMVRSWECDLGDIRGQI